MSHFSAQEESAPTEDFVMHKFKTEWCPIGGPHNWDDCVYAHTLRDWRRMPLIVGYSSRPCGRWIQSLTKGNERSYAERCPNGIACPMAHGAKEQLYHPHFYKTMPCSEVRCQRGVLCAFMHGPEDARVRLPEDSKQQQRDPIPGVALLLAMHQRSYQNPPKFHVEEQTKRHQRRGGGARAAREAHDAGTGAAAKISPPPGLTLTSGDNTA